MEVSGQLHAPAALPPGKDPPRYPLDRGLGGPQNRSGRDGEEKNSQPLPGHEPPIVQPVVRRYTNGAIPAIEIILGILYHKLFLNYRNIINKAVTHSFATELRTFRNDQQNYKTKSELK
jgi:hypothetical protein